MIATSLPKRILSQPEGALSAGVEAQWIRVFPNNQQSIVGPAQTVSATTLNAIPFVSTPVRFSIPCGQSRGAYYDPAKSRLNFRVNYACTALTSTASNFDTYLQGGCLSWWDRLTHFNANGQAIDDETSKALIELHKQIYSSNSAERDSIAQMYGMRYEAQNGTTNTVTGANSNYLSGHVIEGLTIASGVNKFNGASGAAVGVIPISNNYYSYSVPLPSSLIGSGAKNMFPCGRVAKLDIELVSNAVAPVISAISAATAGTFQFTIDQISIDLYLVTLDEKSVAMLPPAKEHFVHGITHRVSTGAISSGTSGSVSTLIGLRGQSVRGLATRFQEATASTTYCVNGLYDSKIPLVTSLNYWLAGRAKFPQMPHNTIQNSSAVFNSAIQASEAFTQREMRYGGNPRNFCRFTVQSTVPTLANSQGYDYWLNEAGSTTYVGDLAGFSFAEDLRKTSTSTILDGFNLSTAANNFLELSFASALSTSALNLYFIAAMDIIYVIDEFGNIESRY